MKTILITGASRGLGLAAARQLASAGHRVLLTARTLDKARAAAQEIGAVPLAMDVADDASVAAAAREVAERFGVLDTLVNNAAILLDGEIGVLDLSLDDFLATLAANTVAPVRTAQAFVPLLRKSDDPRIVNVSSGAGQLGDGEPATWAAGYSASKSALNMITQQLASALPDFAVNSVSPGWCRTAMGGGGAPRSPEKGADGIAWLAAEAPSSLTGRFFLDRGEIPW